MIKLQGIGKLYDQRPGQTVRALRDATLTVEAGEFVAVVGASGSGKSTLMNVIGLLDQPSEGSYRLEGRELKGVPADELARLRNKKMGFVFQAFHLLPRTSALENVEFPLLYSERRSFKGLARAALRSVGLEERIHHYPSELSGGQQQRVAIARALVNEPDIVLADEPTGQLDTRAGLEIMSIFQQLHRAGRTILLVTHDPHLAAHAERVVRLEDGRVVSDEPVAHPKDAAAGLARLPATAVA